MKSIETKSGFKCKIDEEALDDMRLLELIAGLEENPLYLTKLLELFLGEGQKEKLYKHVENKKGRVPVSVLQEELTEIIEQAGEESIKKS